MEEIAARRRLTALTSAVSGDDFWSGGADVRPAVVARHAVRRTVCDPGGRRAGGARGRKAAWCR